MRNLSGTGGILVAVILILFGILALTGWLDFILRILGVLAIIGGGLMIVMNLAGGGKKSSGGYDGDY